MPSRPYRRARVVLPLISVLVGACDGDGPLAFAERPPAVATAVTSLPVGAPSIPLVLANRSVKTWEYGACAHALDRMGLAGWTTVYDSRFRPCIAIGYSLGPGATDTTAVELPAEPGVYRVRFGFTHFPVDRVEHVEVTSNTFRVGTVALPSAR